MSWYYSLFLFIIATITAVYFIKKILHKRSIERKVAGLSPWAIHSAFEDWLDEMDLSMEGFLDEFDVEIQLSQLISLKYQMPSYTLWKKILPHIGGDEFIKQARKKQAGIANLNYDEREIKQYAATAIGCALALTMITHNETQASLQEKLEDHHVHEPNLAQVIEGKMMPLDVTFNVLKEIYSYEEYGKQSFFVQLQVAQFEEDAMLIGGIVLK